MTKYICPYCGTELPNERSAHCGEVGHAEEVRQCPRCKDEYAPEGCLDPQCPSEGDVP